MCLINSFDIFTRTANKDIMLDLRVDVYQQLIWDYRARKQSHAEQDDLDTPQLVCKLKHQKSTFMWYTRQGGKKNKKKAVLQTLF